MSEQQQDLEAAPPSPPTSNAVSGNGNDTADNTETAIPPPPPVNPPTAEPPASSAAELPASTTGEPVSTQQVNFTGDESTPSSSNSSETPVSANVQSVSENNDQSKDISKPAIEKSTSSVITDVESATEDVNNKVDESQANTSTTNVEQQSDVKAPNDHVDDDDDDDEYDPVSILSDEDDLENVKTDMPDNAQVGSSSDQNANSSTNSTAETSLVDNDGSSKDVMQVALSIPFRSHPKFMAMPDSEKVALIADYMNDQNDPKFSILFDENDTSVATNAFCKRGDLSVPMTQEELDAFNKFTATELEIQNNNGWDDFPPDSRLFIGHLGGLNIDKQLLWRICSPYGTVYQITLRPNFAFIQYSNKEECEAAIKGESNVPLLNRTLILEISKPHPKKENISKRSHPDGNNNDNNKRGRVDNSAVNNNSKYKSASNNFPAGTQCFIYVKHAASKKLVNQLLNMLNNGVIRANTMDVAPFVSIKSLINDAAYSGILGTVVVHRDGNMDCYMFEPNENNGSGGIQFDEYEGLTLDQVNQLFISAAAKHPENTGCSGNLDNGNNINNNNSMMMSNHHNMKNNNNRKKDHGRNFRTRDMQDNANHTAIGNRGGRSNNNNMRHNNNNNNRRNNNNNYNGFNQQQQSSQQFQQAQQYGSNGMAMNPEVIQTLKRLDAGTLQNFLSLVNQIPSDNNNNNNNNSFMNSNGSSGGSNGYNNNNNNFNNGSNGYGNSNYGNSGYDSNFNNNSSGYGNNTNMYYGNNGNSGYDNGNTFQQQQRQPQHYPGNQNMMSGNVYGMMSSSASSSNQASIPPPVNKSNEGSGSGPSNISNLMQTLKRLQGN